MIKETKNKSQTVIYESYDDHRKIFNKIVEHLLYSMNISHIRIIFEL